MIAIFTGKELATISLPIKIMIPESILYSYANMFGSLKYLSLAA